MSNTQSDMVADYFFSKIDIVNPTLTQVLGTQTSVFSHMMEFFLPGGLRWRFILLAEHIKTGRHGRKQQDSAIESGSLLGELQTM